MKKLTPEQLAELEQDIKALEPQLVDLSFGCRIYHEKEGLLVFVSQKYCQKKEHDSENGCVDTDYCNNLCALREKDERVIYGNYWTQYTVIGHPITLEHCRKSAQRHREKTDDFLPSEQQIDAYEKAWWGINTNWQDLQPWKEQHSVHVFLYDYLCRK